MGFCVIFFSGLYHVDTRHNIYYKAHNNNQFCSIKFIKSWSSIIKKSSKKYNVDPKLIKSIICIESSGNKKATSHSHAIGLMQIKPLSAGKEVYRFKKKDGHPSIYDLYNPKINIDIGTAYVHILQNRDLVGINNTEMLRYATIVSYVNGSDTLLKILSNNRRKAVKKINKMTKKEFFYYIKKNIQPCKLGNILKK